MAKLEAFKNILNHSQEDLKIVLENFLESHGYKPTIGDGFLYAKGTIPILLVAHMDTVHKQKIKDIFYDEEQEILWSPQGIGGDDRCGVYIICKILGEKHRPHVLFLEDEEKGGVGAKKCVQTLKAPNVRYMIEIDRRGSDDCVFYRCDNEKFTEYVESFGFEKAIGTYTDIVDLSKEWKIASVNVSAGYYNEHTLQEYICYDDVLKTSERIVDMLKDDDKTYWQYIEKKYVSYSYGDKKNDINKNKALPTTTTKKDDIKENDKDIDKALDNDSFFDEYVVDWDGYGFQGIDLKWHTWDYYKEYYDEHNKKTDK